MTCHLISQLEDIHFTLISHLSSSPQVIENSMMRFAKAWATPNALDANGELLPEIRKELAQFEIDNTWASPSAWGFSIKYRSKTTVGAGSGGYTIPAG